MKNNIKIFNYYKSLGFKENRISNIQLESIYLNGLLDKSELHNKIILEVGAGASQYVDYFLDSNIKKYIGIELVESRIPKHIKNKRKIEYYCCDYLDFKYDKQVDIIFISLTYMYLTNRINFFEITNKLLKKEGMIIFFEPNFFSPITIFRTIKSKLFNNSPTKPFSPIRLKKELLSYNYKIKYYKYVTRNFFFCNNILLGTNLKIKAIKT